MEKSYNNNLLNAAYTCWQQGFSRVTQRDRLKRYTYGDQWGDMITDKNGAYIREGDAITASGREPLTNNLIRRLVKTIVGRYRNMRLQQRDKNALPADVGQDNHLEELDARLLEEFLISGMAIQRVAREKRHGVEKVYIDNVSPKRLFVNNFSDARGNDIEMIGMLHDMSIHEVLERFGAHDRRRFDRLRTIFAVNDSNLSFPMNNTDVEFFAAPWGRCRVIEMWTLEAIESAKRNIVDISFAWRCRWLAPDGTLLASYFSPWPHKSHPFVLKFYPLIDGEVHPFVEDVIDQQRFINRLIVMVDKIMGASAKGVLLFPENQKPSGFGWDEISRRWSATDTIIPITGNGNIVPQQIHTTAGDCGAYNLLDIEMKLFGEVSGVSDALLGEKASGNEGNAMYQNRVNNSTIALADTFQSFNNFITQRDNKCRLISDYNAK